MNRHYTTSLLIFLLSIAVYGVIEWYTPEQDNVKAIEDELTPDFIAETLQSDIYAPNGKLSHQVNAQRMEHYTEFSFTHFEFPEYTLYSKNSKKPWRITAAEGTLYSNNRVILENRVTLKAMDEDSLIKEIHCKYLELDLNTNIISSDQTIMVQGKDFTMYGSGLIVDLNTTQMTLTEHVQTIYKKSQS